MSLTVGKQSHTFLVNVRILPQQEGGEGGVSDPIPTCFKINLNYFSSFFGILTFGRGPGGINPVKKTSQLLPKNFMIASLSMPIMSKMALLTQVQFLVKYSLLLL